MPEVLLIHNHQPERSLLFAQLREEGFQVSAVETLQEVLPSLARLELRPEVVVLDTREQRWTERELRELRLVLPGVPLVVVSGARDAAALSLLREVADELLVRPVSVGQVAEAVRRVLARPR